jgi:hypothetical protein
MKPAGSRRNMAANIDAPRQNASRVRRKRGDILGDGVGRHRRRVSEGDDGYAGMPPRSNVDASPEARTLHRQWLAEG